MQSTSSTVEPQVMEQTTELVATINHAVAMMQEGCMTYDRGEALLAEGSKKYYEGQAMLLEAQGKLAEIHRGGW